MIILGCNNINLSFGVTKILENITFNLQESDKAGIVGVNGAGKSTLFKILIGLLQPDSGEIFTAKGRKTGYLAQDSGLTSSGSIWNEMLTTFSELIEMEKKQKLLEERISTEKDKDILAAIMKEYSLLTEAFSRSGGYEYKSRAKGVLRGLGFSDHQFDLSIQALSGGQKTRLALAKLLLEEPDILLMDEPTNHLDIDALEWLEDFLRSYKKCVLIISHDRYFLDEVTTKTIEIENCECKVYNGNYSSYISQKAESREIYRKHYEMQQKEIARLENFIEQQRRWNREKNIIAAESRQKAIDRIEKLEKPPELPSKIQLKFRSTIISGNDVLFAEGLSKQYPGKLLFKDISFKISKNDRAFILGPNGCGKSTLIKILAGLLPQDAGSVEYGHKVSVGYYDQEQEDLDENKTVIEEVWSSNEKLTQTDIRTTLAAFLFKGEDVFKQISILSGGEKSRAALAKLILSQANFLLLDEPTNHLDINSREALEQALQDYGGTILAISHDRYFIKKLSTRILEFNDSGLLDFRGSYESYIEHRNKTRKGMPDSPEEKRLSAAKQEHLANKEQKARQRRLEKNLNDTELEISYAESRIKEIEHEMAIEEVFTDHIMLTRLHDEQTSLREKLAGLYGFWEELMEESGQV